jgi:hypothetical protein
VKDLTLSTLIRYGYGGLLLFVILLLKDPVRVKGYVEGAGSVLAPLAVLGIGACFYVLYRHLLGEWFLYPLAHIADWVTSKENRGPNPISPIWHLRNLGLPYRQCRNAYNAVRREFLPEQVTKQLNMAHSEIHVLYITALEIPLLAAFRVDLWPWPYVVATAVLALLAALAADVRQHRYEHRSIVSTHSVEQLTNFLTQRGYTLTKPPPSND